MTFGYGLGHLALNLTAMESSMEKYTKMLGFPSLEALKAEYSTEASSSWENVARSVAQSESVASGGQRPGIGSSAWRRNPAAIAPALPQRCFLGEWSQESRQFGLQLLHAFRNNLGRALGGCEGSGSRSKTSETHESHEMPMAKLDFDQLAFQYVEDGFPAVSSEAVLFIPALDASTYQDGTPIVENEVQGFHGTRSSILPTILMQGLRSSKRSHGVTGVWITTQRGFCYEWGFTPFELFAGAAVHVACPLEQIVKNRRNGK